jgi:hypothetical protein
MEEVVQRRKEKAQEMLQELRDDMANSRKSAGGGNSLLGIGNLNFVSMKERTAALEESVYSNQDTIMSNRSILDEVLAKKKEKEEESARNMMPPESAEDGEGEAPAVSDRLDMIEAKASGLRQKMQADQDATQLKVEAGEQYELNLKAQAEARRYILFDLGGTPSARAALVRPSSAPPGAAVNRPSSSLSIARPPSAASVPARPSSVIGARYAAQPLSARSGGVLRVPSRPCSANSMRSRMKALEENVARNKKTLTNNRDGLEVVKKRRAERAQAAAQLLVDIKRNHEEA